MPDFLLYLPMDHYLPYLLRNRKCQEPLTGEFGMIFPQLSWLSISKEASPSRKANDRVHMERFDIFCHFAYSLFILLCMFSKIYMSSNHLMSLKTSKRKTDSLCCHSPMSMMINRWVLTEALSRPQEDCTLCPSSFLFCYHVSLILMIEGLNS